jgi:hypothetical protein
VNWHKLRQEGLLTLAIVLACCVILNMLFPLMSLRSALLAIAVVALFLGWVP